MYEVGLPNWAVSELAGLGSRSRSSNSLLYQGQVNNDTGWPGRETWTGKATSYPAATRQPFHSGGDRIEAMGESIASLGRIEEAAKPAKGNGNSAT